MLPVISYSASLFFLLNRWPVQAAQRTVDAYPVPKAVLLRLHLFGIELHSSTEELSPSR